MIIIRTAIIVSAHFLYFTAANFFPEIKILRHIKQGRHPGTYVRVILHCFLSP